MARVRIGKDGKTGTIDSKELPLAIKDGWAVVDAPQAGEAEEASPEDQEEDRRRVRNETLYDAGNGAMRGLTMGFDDVAAGAGAYAGDAYQSWADGRPRDPTAYQQGVDGRREEVRQSRERSPTATSAGEFAGTLATIAVPAGRVLKAPVGRLAKVGRAAAAGALGGAVGGVGDGDSDTLYGAAGDAVGGAAAGAAIGATLGGAALVPGAVGAARRGGWRALVTGAKKADDALSMSPALDVAADFVPGVAGARKLAKRYAPVEEATQSLAPEAEELSKDVLQKYLDRLAPKVADDVPTRPAWLRETAADSLDDIMPTPKVSGRALPLTETEAEIARRKAIQSFLYDD